MSDAAPAELLAGATAKLAAFGAALDFEQLPPHVVDHLKLCILDGLGCILHGAALPWTARVAAMVAADGGAPEATAFGLDARVPAAAAALVNGTAGHAFELDDIHRDSIIHPNSLTLAVTLALAERAGGASGHGRRGAQGTGA